MKTNRILITLLLLTGLSLGFVSCSEEKDPAPVIGQDATFTLSAQAGNEAEANDFEATIYYGTEALENSKHCVDITQITYKLTTGHEIYVKVVANKPMKIVVVQGSTFESYLIDDASVHKITI